MAAIKELVLYGMPACSACDSVKSFLKARLREYTYVDITTDRGWEAFQRDFPNGRSVPSAVLVEDALVTLKAIGSDPIMKLIKTGA